MGDRIIDWGWSVVLLVLGAVGTLVSRWLSMIHKHEKQLILLEAEQATRLAANEAMVKNLADLNARLDLHRQESMGRMDSLRRELREDFKTLIEYHSRIEERERSRGG